MFTYRPGVIHLYGKNPATAKLSVHCTYLTVDDPLIMVDTCETTAKAAGATLYLVGVDAAAVRAVPWAIDSLAFDHDGARISFSLADEIEFASPALLRLRTRGERDYPPR